MSKIRLNKKTKRSSEGGQITLDFLFGCILIIGVSAVLGALTFALTLTEVIQYVSFSAARNYFAGDIDYDTQSKMASGKASLLLSKLPFLSGAQQSGWIKIAKGGGANNYSDAGTGYQSTIGVPADTDPSIRRTQFVGYQITFTLPIMNISIPLFGQLLQPPEGEQDFTGTVSSFLMREPSTHECMDYTRQIYDVLKAKGYTNAPSAQYTPINDNGC
jgi:hypothetical protein